MATMVTGATGFIGSHITRKLVERGERVKVLVRKTSNTKNIDSLDVEKVYGDVGSPDSLRAAFSGCDTLYHTAGFVSFKKIRLPEDDRREREGFFERARRGDGRGSLQGPFHEQRRRHRGGERRVARDGSHRVRTCIRRK